MFWNPFLKLLKCLWTRVAPQISPNTIEIWRKDSKMKMRSVNGKQMNLMTALLQSKRWLSTNVSHTFISLYSRRLCIHLYVHLYVHLVHLFMHLFIHLQISVGEFVYTSRGNTFLVCFHLLHALQVCARNGPRIIKTKVVKIAEICFLIKL